MMNVYSSLNIPLKFFFTRLHPQMASKTLFISSMDEYSSQCKPNDIFVYSEKEIPKWFFLHLISIVQFRDKFDVLGVQLTDDWRGFVSVCKYITPILAQLRGNSSDVPMKHLDKSVYYYRWDVWTRNMLTDFDPFECPIHMTYPCNYDFFEFKCPIANRVDLGLIPTELDIFLEKTGIVIQIGTFHPCVLMCIQHDSHVLLEGYPIVNNCDLMKKRLKCKVCMTFDEGSDQPFSFENKCRLRTRPQWDTYHHGPLNGHKICPCVKKQVTNVRA
jgi:hypothetical protein